MKRRINHTDRKRIKREHIDLHLDLNKGGGPAIFDLRGLDLSSYPFPGDSLIRLEATYRYSRQRWNLGTVANRRAMSEDERRLTDVDAAALFRVVVVTGDGSGKLLGHAQHLKPVHPEVDGSTTAQRARSLLHMEVRDDLGEEVWRFEFGEFSDQPKLLLNSSVEGLATSVTTNPAFYSLVIPNIFRTILTQIVIVDPQERDDDSGGWHIGWLNLADRYAPGEAPYLGGIDEPDDDQTQEARDWIDWVVQGFAAETLHAAERYKEALRSVDA